MIEVERKFLLDRLPDFPPGAEMIEIEQGYLCEPRELSIQRPGDLQFGRLRRAVFPDGRIICTHTIKTGTGAVRNEMERTITIEEFQRHWPGTVGRRLRKRRHRVREADVVWEIDEFAELDLILAEIELDSPNAPVQYPPWLEPHVVKEVTDDPFYTNAAIAARLGLSLET